MTHGRRGLSREFSRTRSCKKWIFAFCFWLFVVVVLAEHFPFPITGSMRTNSLDTMQFANHHAVGVTCSNFVIRTFRIDPNKATASGTSEQNVQGDNKYHKWQFYCLRMLRERQDHFVGIKDNYLCDSLGCRRGDIPIPNTFEYQVQQLWTNCFSYYPGQMISTTSFWWAGARTY